MLTQTAIRNSSFKQPGTQPRGAPVIGAVAQAGTIELIGASMSFAWWRNWKGRRRAMAELDCCGSAEMEHIARDVGASGADLSVLAGKWPDAADLLYWRMNEIALDRKEITQSDPQVKRDLQRVCTVCGSKRRCKHALAKNPSDPAWQKYCPNATTLSALAAERTARAKAN